MSEPTRVTIAGGGLAGLTAALRLAERGYRVKLYEQKPILGGVLASRPVGAGLELGAAPARRLDQMRAGGFGDGAGLVARAAIDQDRLLDNAFDHGRYESREGMGKRALGVEGRDDDRDHGAEPIGARRCPGNLTGR